MTFLENDYYPDEDEETKKFMDIIVQEWFLWQPERNQQQIQFSFALPSIKPNYICFLCAVCALVIKKVNKVILTYRTYHECASNHSPTSLHMPACSPTLPSHFFLYSRSIDDWIRPNIHMLHSVVGVLCNAKLMSGKMSYPPRWIGAGGFWGLGILLCDPWHD